MAIKLIDIAEAAGVTAGTVSAALSGRGRISNKTCTHIREIAARMGYTPNISAQILKQQTLVDVGYIISDTKFSCIHEFLNVCKAFSLRSQFDIIIPGLPQKSQLLNPSYCKGILHLGEISPEVQAFLDKNPDFPFVAVNEKASYCVRSDEREGIKSVLEYLIARGHTRIGMALCKSPFDVHLQMNEAIVDSIGKLKYDYNPEWMCQFSYSGDASKVQEDTRLWAADILRNKNRPSAFFCASVLQARAIIYEASKLNITIPDDLAIIAHGVADLGTDAYPFVSVIAQDYKRNILEGLTLLQRLISGQEIENKQILTEMKLIPRHSTEKHMAF